MQDKEITSYDNNQRDVSSHTQQFAEQIGNLCQNTSLPSIDTLKQILVTLPEPYQTMGRQAIAEHFVNTMQLHLLQIISTFYQQAADEDIDAEERNETLKDVEANTYHIMMLNKQLAINSLESLLRLGKITFSVLDLSRCDNAEEAQRWMYKLPHIYQNRLEQEHLTEKGFDATIKLPQGSTMVQAKMIIGSINSNVNFSASDSSRSEQYRVEQVSSPQEWGKVLSFSHQSRIESQPTIHIAGH